MLDFFQFFVIPRSTEIPIESKFWLRMYVSDILNTPALKLPVFKYAYLNLCFKATQEARIALERKSVWLWSPSMDAMCGRFDLTPGKTWIVSGRMIGSKPYISLCGFAQLWSEVTPRQRKGFRQLYHRSCACPVSYYSNLTEFKEKTIIFDGPK